MEPKKQHKDKKDWRKDAKEILEIIAYAVVCGMIVFQLNGKCSHTPDNDAHADAKQNIKKVELAADSLRHNQMVRTR